MRDNAILGVKGLAIIGVVLHHIGNRRFGVETGEAIAALSALFGWCVLAFFAVSGWLHSVGEKRMGKEIGMYVRSRAFRLLLPFLVLVIVYSILWQVIQVLGVSGLRGSIPDNFLGKIWASIPPTHGREVAEQLYFMPLLFFVCVTAHAVWRFLGLRGVLLLCMSSLVVGGAWFPGSPNTGLSLGVSIWGMFCYSAGFLLHRSSEGRWLLPSAIGLALCVVISVGLQGLAKAAPILLLASMHPLRLHAVPVIPSLGEASATIYAYHTPFVLQPFVIAASFLRSPLLQFLGAIAASVVALVVCTVIFYRLRSTRMRFAIL